MKRWLVVLDVSGKEVVFLVEAENEVDAQNIALVQASNCVQVLKVFEYDE